jgi:hypothetical protein
MARLLLFFKRLFGKQIPHLDFYHCDRAKKLVGDYENLRAKRVLPVPLSTRTLSQYTQQAADALEREGRERAPTLENEVRLLSLAVRELLNDVIYLHDHLNYHVK